MTGVAERICPQRRVADRFPPAASAAIAVPRQRPGDDRPPAVHGPRPELPGSPVADQLAALRSVTLREKRAERNVGEVGVTVPGLPIREGEFGGLCDRADMVGAEETHRPEVEAAQQS